MWLTSSGQWEREGGESDAEWYWWVLHVVDSWCAVSCEVCSIADLDPCQWTRRQPDWNRVNTVCWTVTLCHDRTTSVDLGVTGAQRRHQFHWHTFTNKQSTNFDRFQCYLPRKTRLHVNFCRCYLCKIVAYVSIFVQVLVIRQTIHNTLIYKSVVIITVLYACPAWWELTTAAAKQRIEAFSHDSF